MRSLVLVVVFVLSVGIIASGSQAQDKEVTLKGNIMCAQCALKEGKACQTIIQVKESGKDITYYFVDKGSVEIYHEEVCGGEKLPGTVVGRVADKDGKKWVTPKKVSYDKK